MLHRKPLIVSQTTLPNDMRATGNEDANRYTMILDTSRDTAEIRSDLSRIMMILKYRDANPEKPLAEIVKTTSDYTWDFSEAPDLQRKYPCGCARWKEFH